MRPSRRVVLKSGALSLAWFGGCSAGRDAAGGDTPTPIGFGSPSSPEPTLTPGADTDIRCGSGPLPAEGWPYPAGSWGRTNYAPLARGPTEKPSVSWSALPSEPEQARNRFTRPVVADGRVYVGRRFVTQTHTEPPDERGVIAYDADAGEERWRTRLPGPPGTPTLFEDRLIVHDGSAVHALDAEDGKRLWTTEIDDAVTTIQPIPTGVLAVTHPGGDDQFVLELAPDGGVRWRVPMAETVSTAPAWAADRAYLGRLDGRLVAIDSESGALAWAGKLPGRGGGLGSMAATPCAAFTTKDGGLHAVNRSGGLAWSVEADIRRLATDGTWVYGLGGDGYVRAFAIEDGAGRWETSTGGSYHAGPAVDGQSIYAGWLEGGLVNVAADTGDWRWTLRRDWDGPTRVVVAGTTLYATWGRRVVAFR